MAEVMEADGPEGRRARLKVYIGAAPGVGKTQRMIREAQELKRQGCDVVVGALEGHGSADVQAAASGLELLPPKYLRVHGETLPEFDLEGALQRKPGLVLLDDLAHLNHRGARHGHRWQDAWDLLDAGIDVHATVNIHHVESLRDVVTRITGLKVRDTVPDTLLARADQMELVDLPPEELLDRYRAGRVHLPESARHAADRIFRRANLLALRELALRKVGEHVDVDLRRAMTQEGLEQGWGAGERLLVCITGSPSSEGLIRVARRMAGRLDAPWIAVHVESSRRMHHAEASRDRLEEFLRLVERLGGESVVLQGEAALADELVALARQRQVTRIIIGKPAHGRWLDPFAGTLVDRLVKRSGDIDVMVVSPDRQPGEEVKSEHRRIKLPRVSHLIWSAVVVALGSGLGLLMARRGFEVADIAMVHVLAILIVATRFGRWTALVATAMSTLTFAYCFLPPRFSFALGSYRHLGTLAVMVAVGAVIGNLAERIRRQVRLAGQRERRTQALFRLSAELARGDGSIAQIEAAVRGVAGQFRSTSTLIPRSPKGGLQPPATLALAEFQVAEWVFQHAEAAGLGTDTFPESQALYLPLLALHGSIGVLALQPEGQHRWDEADQRHLLEAFANQAALALERVMLSEDARQAQRNVLQEQRRSALLRSASRELGTPLGAITSAASGLLSLEDPGEDGLRRTLVETIRTEGRRVRRLVGNLAVLSDLEAGELRMKPETISLSELLGAAREALPESREQERVCTELGPKLPPLQGDRNLLALLLANLLDNALQAGAPEPVTVKAWATEHAMTLVVRDLGPALLEDQEGKLLEMSGTDAGLGLCHSIVEAHGGQIQLVNHPQGGRQFLVSLPLGGEGVSGPA